MSDFSISHVSKLAKISLSPEGSQKLEADIEGILDFIKQIQSVDVSGVEEISMVNALTNISRSDEIQTSLDRDEVLAEAPLANSGYVKVPKVLE